MSKIKIAFITPTDYLHNYASQSDIHMSLAHLVLEDEKYASFYKNESKNGKFLIMDNSAFELESQGRGVSPDLIIEAAKKVKAHEIVVPDILFKKDDTIDAVKDFMKYIKNNYSEMIGNVKFMAVPQADNKDDWWECYNKLVTMQDITTIGLSKLSIPESFWGNHKDDLNCFKSRVHVVASMINDKNTPKHHGKETHLLGSDNGGPFELWFYQAAFQAQEWIRSNDTSMPFVYGMNEKIISFDSKMIKNIIMDKLDFGLTQDITSKQIKAINNNFLVWRGLHVN